MQVIGLDVSTRMGYALLQGDDILDSGVVHFEPAANRFHRWARYAERLESLVAAVGGSGEGPLVAIEGYSFQSRIVNHALVELAVTVRVRLHEMAASVIEVPPATLKKFVTGRGNSKKQDMLLGIYKRWGREFRDDNEADAYALARVGQAYLGEDVGVPKASLDALTKVKSLCTRVHGE